MIMVRPFRHCFRFATRNISNQRPMLSSVAMPRRMDSPRAAMEVAMASARMPHSPCVVFVCLMLGLSLLLGATTRAAAAPLDSLAIEVQYGGPGVVTPSGIVMVARGASLALDLAPTGCAVVRELLVDDQPVMPQSPYTLADVQSDHIVYISFGLRPGVPTLAIAPASGSCAVPETLTASVPGAQGGTVYFLSGGEVLGTSEVSDGIARWIVDPPLVTGVYTLSLGVSGSQGPHSGASS